MYSYVMPAGGAFSWEGQAGFSPTDDIQSLYQILGFTNSSTYIGLTNLVAGQHKYAGYLNTICCDTSKLSDVSQAVESIVKELISWDSANECSTRFLCVTSFSAFDIGIEFLKRQNLFSTKATYVAEMHKSVSGEIANSLDVVGVFDQLPEYQSFSPIFGQEFSNYLTKILAVSYFFGVIFGRWDIRYATGEQAAPELPDPFAPLPVCPPGQLQNAQGLPLGEEEVGRMKEEGNWNYPIEIPWDGILVDDPNHPLDIERRVREVIEIIWNGKGGGPTAEAIEHEACEILGVKSLRDYFRKPTGFFADHLKRYSKSRRQAPIYWPLSTASGSYTLWIYYHRLTDQTLHTVLADFLEPKIRNVQAELDAHQAGGNGQKAGESRDFLDELKDLRDEIERIIKLPWKPNLNDGVLITASPLWKLFRLTKWQKDLKACWDDLEAGEYDWAHLAYSIWPQRVEKACERDRSIAIAHGLEHLCKVEPPKPKKKRAKKAAEDESKNGEPKLI